MANREHLEILQQGVEIWNEWREENPNVMPDLSEADLNRADLLRVDLRKANLINTSLSEVNLTLSNLSGANLSGADLSRASFLGANLSEANLSGANLSGADLSGADLSGANLIKADLILTHLGGAKLAGASLNRAKLIRAKISGAKISGANLSEADFTEADFTEADLIEADLSGAKLVGAALGGTVLSGAFLNRADLRRADLGGAKLRGTVLNRANLSEANFHEAQFIQTILADVNLSGARGLDSVIHHGPSTIGIDTFFRSGGLPESFLKGAGVPDIFLEYASSLVGTAIEYYSAFISYSHVDQEFAERIYADLQSNGVRCWFAPEDLKIGEKFRIGIDESIRIHDKLLLILSEHSVASDWVEQEVETALAKERETGQLVLFPVRLDDTITKVKAGWPALIKNTRHIGDFRHWKNHDKYQKAFQQLIRDLKAEA